MESRVITFNYTTSKFELDTDVVRHILRQSEGHPLTVISVCGESTPSKLILYTNIKNELSSLQAKVSKTKLKKENVKETNPELATNDKLTDGIWMLDKPQIIQNDKKKIAIILMYIKGPFEVHCQHVTIMALVAMSFVFSSVTILNFDKEVNSNSIDYFLPIADLAHYMSTQQDRSVSLNQNVNFVVQQLEPEQYKQYKKRELRHLQEQLKAADSKSNMELYQCFKNSFESMQVFPFEELESPESPKSMEKYNKYMKRLVNTILLKQLDNKTLLGNPISTEGFIHLMSGVVALFNSPTTMPTDLGFWQVLQMSNEYNAIQTSFTLYKDTVDQLKQGKIWPDEDTITTAKVDGEAQAKRALQQRKCVNLIDCENKLQQKIDKDFATVQDRFDKIRHRYLGNKIEEDMQNCITSITTGMQNNTNIDDHQFFDVSEPFLDSAKKSLEQEIMLDKPNIRKQALQIFAERSRELRTSFLQSSPFVPKTYDEETELYNPSIASSSKTDGISTLSNSSDLSKDITTENSSSLSEPDSMSDSEPEPSPNKVPTFKSSLPSKPNVTQKYDPPNPDISSNCSRKSSFLIPTTDHRIPDDSFEPFSSQAFNPIRNHPPPNLPPINNRRQPYPAPESTPIYGDHKLFDGSDEGEAIGIDLGTTFCCMGHFQDGKVVIIPNSIGKPTTPSYLAILKNGDYTIGEAAKKRSVKESDATVYNIKRLIGQDMSNPTLHDDIERWPFKVIDEEGAPKVEILDKTYFPEELSGMLLRRLVEDAKKYLNKNITKAVITVPAYFNDAQRRATTDAGEMAGLNVLAILNEPTAAAIAYNADNTVTQPMHFLVFDLGGGTFDVVIFRADQGKIDTLAVQGDNHLGGEDFDKNMVNFCAQQFKDGTGIDLFDEINSPNKIRRDGALRRIKRIQMLCEKQKEDFSMASETGINIDALISGEDMDVTMTKGDFDRINQSLFAKTMELVDSTIRSANLTKSQIDKVILIGGSAKIVKIQQMLSNYFGQHVVDKTINSDEAVAYGAALHAAKLNQVEPVRSRRPSTDGKARKWSNVSTTSKVDVPMADVCIQDITSISYGLELANGRLSIIIPRYTKIPSTLNKVYETSYDYATTITIEIYQGERPIAANSQNVKLGKFVIDEIPKNKAGKESVNISMTIDNNGILKVMAKVNSTGKSKFITVNSSKNTENNALKKELEDYFSKEKTGRQSNRNMNFERYAAKMDAEYKRVQDEN